MSRSDKRVRLVNFGNTDRSNRLLRESVNLVRLVSPASAERSDTELPERFSSVRLVNSDNADRSDRLLRESINLVRLIAALSPVKSLMSALSASSVVKLSISAAVMGAMEVLPSPLSISARRLGSGISTTSSAIGCSILSLSTDSRLHVSDHSSPGVPSSRIRLAVSSSRFNSSTERLGRASSSVRETAVATSASSSIIAS